MAAVFVAPQRARPIFAALFACWLSAWPQQAEAQPVGTGAETSLGAATLPASDFDLPPAGGRRSYLQGALTKIRPGAYLKGELPPPPEGGQIHGPLALARDAWLKAHYARLAQLDALGDEATRNRELRLAERVETARRRDTQQFFLAMQRLKVASLSAWAESGL